MMNTAAVAGTVGTTMQLASHAMRSGSDNAAKWRNEGGTARSNRHMASARTRLPGAALESFDQESIVQWQAATGRLVTLTPRQRQVMDMVLAGNPSKNIAADLGISQRTVENHRASVMQRTGARSLPELARLAFVVDLKLVDEPPARSRDLDAVVGKLEANSMRSVQGPVQGPVQRGESSPDENSVAREADHRVANHFALLAANLRLKAADVAKSAAEPTRVSMGIVLAGVGAQIEAFARLHRTLTSNPSAASGDLSQNLHNICETFRSSLPGVFELTEDFQPGCVVRLDQIVPLTQIFTEVITNSVKHLNGNSDAGKITASCGRNATGALLVEVVDDGPGLPKNFDCRTDGGIGFRLVEALAKQLGAMVTFETLPHGLRFRFSLR